MKQSEYINGQRTTELEFMTTVAIPVLPIRNGLELGMNRLTPFSNIDGNNNSALPPSASTLLKPDSSSIVSNGSINDNAVGGGGGVGKGRGGGFTAGPSPSYEFGSSFGGGGAGTPATPLSGSYALAQHLSYRFANGATPNEPSRLDSSSFYDYSLRRHSLSEQSRISPPRLSEPEPSIPPPNLKRKSTEELEVYGSYPAPSPYTPSNLSSALPYTSNRHEASILFEKVAASNGGVGGRGREGMLTNSGTTNTNANTNWDENRTANGTNYVGDGGGEEISRNRGAMPAYTMTEGIPYDGRAIPFPNSQPTLPSHQRHISTHQDQLYGPPLGSNVNSPDLTYANGSRPSPYPASSQFSSGSNKNSPRASPSLHLSGSNPIAPSTSSLADLAARNQQRSSASYSNLPPAQAAWARAGPLPSSAHHNNLKSGSLTPASAYGSNSSNAPSKDSPYSRSPELRVSHKLAERKRRKEMAQLFDDLRDALPFDRGLKSSKWEILSKAVDFIANLKDHNSELSRDNTLLRDHFGLGPGTLLCH